jgi:uncharacterized protein YejL (UPF0352 family)
MRERVKRQEVWRRAAARMTKVKGPAKAKVLQQEIAAAGLTMQQVIGRVVTEYLGKDPAEDQVRALAATFSLALGVKADRFFDFWLEGRSGR